jgi:hypothetical protein
MPFAPCSMLYALLSLLLIPGRFSFMEQLRLKSLPDTGVRQDAENFSQIQKINTCVIFPGRGIGTI